MLVTVDGEQLAEAARQAAQQHPPRSRERRAAAVLWTALNTTTTVAAARKALSGFAAPQTQADALALLGRLIRDHAATEGTPR